MAIRTKAEAAAHRIQQVIAEARADGVNVMLEWDDDEDGMHVWIQTSVHRRQPEGFMKVIDGPFIVEGY